jgi:hypothetical protein
MVFEVSKEGESTLGPRRIFVGLVFLALGMLGLFAVAGAVDWDGAVERWWPLAVVGWGITEVIEDRRATLFDAFLLAIGLTLLAAEQAWAVDGVLWSVLFLFAGGAILLAGRGGPSRTDSACARPSDSSGGRADPGKVTAQGRRLLCPWPGHWRPAPTEGSKST